MTAVSPLNLKVLLQNYDETKVNAVHNFVVTQYLHPKRYYHNIEHIYSMISLYFQYLDFSKDKFDPNLVIAIWFHDLIFQYPDGEDEETSADLASIFLNHLNIKEKDIDEIYGFIMSTDHETDEWIETEEDKIIHDLDLHSLGLDWLTFCRNTEAVRKEYDCSDEEFEEGRKEFFTKILKRKRIFLHPFFYNYYESQARENLQRYLENKRV